MFRDVIFRLNVSLAFISVIYTFFRYFLNVKMSFNLNDNVADAEWVRRSASFSRCVVHEHSTHFNVRSNVIYRKRSFTFVLPFDFMS